VITVLDIESGDKFELGDDLATLDVPDDPPLAGNEMVYRDGRALYTSTVLGAKVSDPTVGPVPLANRRKGGLCMVQDPAQTRPDGTEVYWRSKVLEKAP
jgi:hypothetical protein